MSKNIFPALAVIFVSIVFSSCRTSRELPYFQDLSQTDPVTRLATPAYEPLKLQVNDEIQVTISSNSQESSMFFNLAAVTPNVAQNSGVNSKPVQSFINVYRVGYMGAITLPVLGDIYAMNLTTEDLRKNILLKLTDYLKDAIVTVTLVNFKVTVIGEVGSPIVVPVNGQTINVLEAIGAAGDLTVFGIRKNVRVIRKLADGTTEVASLNLNRSDLLSSPYFQLKQNDIVYVQPNKNKGLQGTRQNVWIPILTSAASIITIILTRN